ncbi:MAG: 2-oxoacid:acceptor oxidoreductase subunit alpha [Lentisphaerae bacterium]|nr:2-oxoacid:acceptor oxidoreductase subunit alpha [Lentisphaerota bacterium]
MKQAVTIGQGASCPCVFLMGSGGDGVVTAGDLLARAVANAGLHCQMVKSFGPQIRGGESGVWLQISPQPIQGPAEQVQIAVVLSWRSFGPFARQLSLAPGALVFQDEQDAALAPPDLRDAGGQPVTPRSLPLQKLADELEAPRSRNILLVGFIAGLLQLPAALIPEVLQRKFGKRGAEVAATLIKAFHRGRELADAQARPAGLPALAPVEAEARLLLSGNDAASLGALHAGVEFFAGYPITPASEIMTAMAEHLPGRGGMMIQAEDEISAICMLLGASFGGKKALTSTSGPGLSLMVEALGFATQIELPCVIIDVQRGGPSTGMPTKTEQSDLQLAVYGAHGDAPRVVIAPENVRTCFDATVKAFYLAEKYQTPVIVLSDQQLGHREETLPATAFDEGHAFRTVIARRLPDVKPGEPYKRFALGDDPVSPMAIPGMEGGTYRTSGIIHDEAGNPTVSTDLHRRMSEKLQRKMTLILAEMPGYRLEGPAHADTLLLTWGSTAGAACDAAARRTAEGRPTAVLIVELLYPLPTEALREHVARYRHVAVAELTFSGQFLRWLRANGLALEQALAIHRGGGDPLTTSEILQRMREAWT